MTTRQLIILLYLSSCLGMTFFWGCQSTYGPDTDAIIRINQQMCTQFRQEQVQELVSVFSDSASLSLPGSPLLQNRQVVRAYWSRFLNPIDLSIRHHKFFSSLDFIEGKTGLSPPLIAILSTIDLEHSGEQHAVFQWTDWQLQYEAEDGVIRSESHPTLLQWTDDDKTGWRITWMGQL